jgi:hypothetical protein
MAKELTFHEKKALAVAHQKPKFDAPDLVVNNSRGSEAPPPVGPAKTTPTFHALHAAARAHLRPKSDAPGLVVNNGRGAAEAAPPDWTNDAMRSVPRPPVFRGPIGPIEGYPEDGKNAWRASNDAVIVAAVNRFNAERNLYPGDAEFMTPKLMKSWMMEESGGHRAEFERDPLQVNNPGDWTEKSNEKQRIAGLRKDQTMTPETSADAALKWLAYKARLHRDGGGRLGPYWTPYEAFQNYNGRGDDYKGPDKAYAGMKHREAYANRILGRLK